MNIQFAKSRGHEAHSQTRSNSSLPFMTILVVTTTLVAGCKVGPDYCSAPAPVQQRWIDADVDPRVCGQPEDVTQWWNRFNDPTLTKLISSLEQQNFDLRGAAWRIQAARSSRGIAAGSLFPQAQTANGNFTRVNNSQTVAAPLPVASYDNWGVTMFDAQWELDFWGKFRRNIEGAEADVQASIATYDDILVSLQGETAATYIQLRTLQQRLKFAVGNVKIQEGLLGIAESRLRNGADFNLDVTQATQNLAQTRALIPQFDAGIRTTRNSLCVLLGTTPGQLDHLLDESGTIPVAPDIICAGVPAELLQRRPDIRAAWHRAAAQSASIGVAITDLYPSFIIAGDIGYQSQNLSGLFTPRSVVGAVGPAFSWKILNYGRIKNNIRLQEDLLQSNLANYQQTVLIAYQEVENGLISFARTHDEIDQLEIATQNALESLKLVRLRYVEGVEGFNRVSTLALDLVGQQDDLAVTQGNLATQVVSVYKALGGGWQARNTGYSIPAEPAPMQVIPQQEPAKEPLPDPPAEEAPAAAVPADGEAPKPVPEANPDAKDNAAGIDFQSPDVVDLNSLSDIVQVDAVKPLLGTAPEMPQDHRTPMRQWIPRLAFWSK